MLPDLGLQCATHHARPSLDLVALNPVTLVLLVLLNHLGAEAGSADGHADCGTDNEHDGDTAQCAKSLPEQYPADQCGKHRLEAEENGKCVARYPTQGGQLQRRWH